MTSHPNRKKVRDWPAYLRAFRDSKNLTQNQLALLLGVSKRAVETWEGGQSEPPAYLALALRSIRG